MFKTIKNFFAKQDSKMLHQELKREIAYRRSINMIMTLDVIENYLIDDMLRITGLLYQKTDAYIKTKAQSLFWEWKNEGIINEFEDFSDETKTWIMAYSNKTYV